jgi:hypothetical protein
MNMEELAYRLRDRINSYIHSDRRAIKVLSRLVAFSIFAAIISTIAPTLADELSTDPSMMEPVAASTQAPSSTSTETTTASPSPTPTSTTTEAAVTRPTISNSSPAPLPESSDSATATGPGVALEVQPSYLMKIPRSIAVDPRAATRFAPHIYASVDDPAVEYTMVCISGAGLRLDIAQKGAANNADEGSDLISGDQSGLLIISSATNRAINLLNSQGGLFISSPSGGLAGRSLTFRFLAVTKPVADPALCGAAQSAATTALRPLELGLSTVKGGGKLK